MGQPYEPQSCSEGTFHASDGTEQTVTYLSGEERGYLEVAGATGFVKHYSGGRYSFAGLLPAEGSTPEELLETLDGATLLNALCEPQAKKSLYAHAEVHGIHDGVAAARA